MIPLDLEITKRTIIPPEDGWEEHTYYLCEVAYSSTNFIHEAIVFNGFNELGAYSCVLSPTVDGKPNPGELFYLKAIKILHKEED